MAVVLLQHLKKMPRILLDCADGPGCGQLNSYISTISQLSVFTPFNTTKHINGDYKTMFTDLRDFST